MAGQLIASDSEPEARLVPRVEDKVVVTCFTVVFTVVATSRPNHNEWISIWKVVVRDEKLYAIAKLRFDLRSLLQRVLWYQTRVRTRTPFTFVIEAVLFLSVVISENITSDDVPLA